MAIYHHTKTNRSGAVIKNVSKTGKFPRVRSREEQLVINSQINDVLKVHRYFYVGMMYPVTGEFFLSRNYVSYGICYTYEAGTGC